MNPSVSVMTRIMEMIADRMIELLLRPESPVTSSRNLSSSGSTLMDIVLSLFMR